MVLVTLMFYPCKRIFLCWNRNAIKMRSKFNNDNTQLCLARDPRLRRAVQSAYNTLHRRMAQMTVGRLRRSSRQTNSSHDLWLWLIRTEEIKMRKKERKVTRKKASDQFQSSCLWVSSMNVARKVVLISMRDKIEIDSTRRFMPIDLLLAFIACLPAIPSHPLAILLTFPIFFPNMAILTRKKKLFRPPLIWKNSF